ncbi:MAG: YtxH domain-containing protein [Candidatus Saccharimonadales bacterium]
MSKTTKRWALGAVVAAAAGYVAGILTAPKSGKETRKDLKETAEKGISEAEKQLKKLHTQLASLMNEAKDKATTLQGSAQKELQMIISKTNTAKEKARDLLSASHEGNADDKDLQKAIDEANKAIDHLRNYLKK